MRIQGILLPSNWNEEGQVTEMVLATSDEAELQIDCHRPPSQFEKYFRQNVIVDGELANSGLLKIRAIDICVADPPPLGGKSEGTARIRRRTQHKNWEV